MIGECLSQRYEILSELGRGGMGVVYRARDPLLERDVAVKVIALGEISPEAEERFRREAQLVGQMDHPGVVPIYDLGAHREYLFFVMPVVEGTTLQALIRRHSLNLEESLEIVAQVGEALDYSHALGVVHRDIKPENIMVTREETQPRARVMDFGLALAGASSRLTRTGKLPGTLIYLSPEQILSGELDGRSDLYSLGTILYECLAGSPPFSGSRYSLLYRIAHEAPPSLEPLGVEPALDGIVASCLAKKPDDRPQGGRQLAEALRDYLSTLGGELGHRVGEPRADGYRLSAANTAGVTPLAGRLRETARLRRELDEATSGGCRFVAIGGEAGMGKTRLLQFVEELARSLAGVLILRGRFSAEDAFPYQGFGELVQDYFRTGLTDASAGVDLADLGADLVALFPGLREIPAIRDAAASSTPLLSAQAAAADHTRIFELLARSLARLAGGRPLVLLLEQLHASEAAVDALQYIVRRLAPTPTLVAATYRPSELSRGHPLWRWVRGMKDQARMSTILLEPLGEDEHRELLSTLLVGKRISDDLVETLYRASEGNPYFIQEWVRWLLESGDVWRGSDDVWNLSSEAAVAHDALPDTIQQAVESRLEQLPDKRLQVLRTASILGPRFDYADLEALAGIDADQAVDDLIRDGWLEEEPRSRGDRLSFASRLARKGLYRGLPRRRRRELHRRHAEHLEARYAGRLQQIYARLVHHFAEADVAGKTIHYARELSREALAGLGWEAAIRACRTALEFVDDQTLAANVDGELRYLLAAALRAEGQLELALREAGRAVRAGRRHRAFGDAAGAAFLAAEVAWQRRLVEETRKWVRRGKRLAHQALQSGQGEPGATACLVRLLTLEATLANLGGEYARAQELRREAEALKPAEASGAREGEPSSEGGPVAEGGTLSVYLPNAPRQREIGTSMIVDDVEVLSNVYETLLRTDDDGHPVPTLCREWEGSPNGRIFRFALREDVRFSDGSPLLASDVKTSFERVARIAELPAPAFRAIEGIEAFRRGESPHLEGVVADGDRMVEFRLRHALPIFPALLTDPRTAVARESGHDSFLGTGPFRWPTAGSRADEMVGLERNPNDWRSCPAPLERLEFLAPAGSYDTVRALRDGEIDLARELRPDELEEILRDPRFASGLLEATQKNVVYVLFNSSGPYSRTLELRRVLAGVLRIRDLVWRTLGRFAQPATGMMPPGILGHDTGRRRPVLTQAEAAKRIAAAGIEPPVVLRGAVHPRLLDRYRPLFRAIQGEWAALGVEVDLETLPRESYQSRAADPTGLDFCFGRWDFVYDDPDNLAFELLHSRFGRAAPYLPDSDADEWIERGRQEVRADHRQRLYHKVETLVAEHAILVPLAYDVRHGVCRDQVRGVRFLASPPFVSYGEISKTSTPPAGLRPSSPNVRHSGSLHVPLPEVVANLDPCRALVAAVSEIVSTVFETLTAIDEGAHVIPRLASEFRLEDGGRRYRFRLRQNVRFHDGRRLSVRDVRYSFERLLRSDVPGAAAVLLPIRGARALRAGEVSELAGFQIVSERELVLDLEAPLPFFPAMLSSATTAIVPEGTEVFDSNWRQGTAGTGAFRVVRFVGGGRVELEANPHYWRAGLPRSDRLVFELGLASERIVSEFLAGRLAVASHLCPADLERLRRDPDVAAGYQEIPGFSTYYLALNTHRGPLADLETRRALACCLDPAGAVRDEIGRIAVAAYGLIPPGLPGLDLSNVPVPQATAAQPLTGLELRCCLHSSYRDTYPRFWQRLVEPLVAAGVELKTIHQESHEALSVGPDVDLHATRWTADYPDSDTFVSLLETTQGLDGPLCGDQELDRWIERGRREVDPAVRHAVYREIERRIRRDARIVPLFHESLYRFVRPEIGGLRLRLRSPVVAYEELGPAS